MKIQFRKAVPEDLNQMLVLLDQIKIFEEQLSVPPDIKFYMQVFDEIQRDPNNEFIVGTIGKQIVAMMHLTYIRGLFFGTNKRAMAEDVRVHKDFRNKGIGRDLMLFAFERSKSLGCDFFQLTTNSWRTDAIGFYKKIGMVDSHIGLRKKL